MDDDVVSIQGERVFFDSLLFAVLNGGWHSKSNYKEKNCAKIVFLIYFDTRKEIKNYFSTTLFPNVPTNMF